MFSRDIKDRTVLRVHECDSKEPQRVTEKPEVRGRTIQIPASAAQGYYGTVPSSAVTSQVRVNNVRERMAKIITSHKILHLRIIFS